MKTGNAWSGGKTRGVEGRVRLTLGNNLLGVITFFVAEYSRQ